MEQRPSRPSGSFDAERTWRNLTALFAFGDRLDFVFVDYTSPDLLSLWRRALREHCRERGQRWSQPASGQAFLDWLEAERRRGLEVEKAQGAARPREVYLGAIPEDAKERWVFARINENRDNLVKSLNGVLCLAGLGDFTKRLAYAAPSVWAMKTRSVDLAGPPPSWAHLPREAEDTWPGMEPEERWDLDVLISAAARDEAKALDMLQRLTAEGIKGVVATDEAGHQALERARLIVLLLSPTYAYSSAWDALRASHLAREHEGELRARIVPVMIGEGPLPGLIRDMTPLDFRTPAAEARNLARLVSALTGEREASTGPGLVPATPMPPGTSAWLDEARFDLSSPHERELHHLLVMAYPDPDAVRRVADFLGIRQELLRWSVPLRYIWHDVMVLAARQKRARSLVHYVLADPKAAPYHAAIRRVIGEAAPP